MKKESESASQTEASRGPGRGGHEQRNEIAWGGKGLHFGAGGTCDRNETGRQSQVKLGRIWKSPPTSKKFGIYPEGEGEPQKDFKKDFNQDLIEMLGKRL